MAPKKVKTLDSIRKGMVSPRMMTRLKMTLLEYRRHIYPVPYEESTYCLFLSKIRRRKSIKSIVNDFVASETKRLNKFEYMIDLLDHIKICDKDKGNCVICLNEMVLGKNVTQLGCGHLYHDDCIRNWLPMSRSCPSCRKSVKINLKTRHGGQYFLDLLESTITAIYQGNTYSSMWFK